MEVLLEWINNPFYILIFISIFTGVLIFLGTFLCFLRKQHKKEFISNNKQNLADFLNGILKHDRYAVSSLVKIRINCTQQFAEKTNCANTYSGYVCQVTLLSVLNGWLKQNENYTVIPIFDKEGNLIEFRSNLK